MQKVIQTHAACPDGCCRATSDPTLTGYRLGQVFVAPMYTIKTTGATQQMSPDAASWPDPGMWTIGVIYDMEGQRVS